MTQAQRSHQQASGISLAFVGAALAAAVVAGAVTYQLTQSVQPTIEIGINRAVTDQAELESAERWVQERLQQSVGATTSPSVLEAGSEWERQREHQTPAGRFIDLSPTAPELR